MKKFFEKYIIILVLILKSFYLGYNVIKLIVMLVVWFVGFLYFKFNFYFRNLSMKLELKRKER